MDRQRTAASADSGGASVEVSIEMSADLSAEISADIAPHILHDPRRRPPPEFSSERTPTGQELADALDGSAAAAGEEELLSYVAPLTPSSAITSPLHRASERSEPGSESAAAAKAVPSSGLLDGVTETGFAAASVAVSTDSPAPRQRLEQLFGVAEEVEQERRRNSYRGTAALDEVVQILGRELSAGLSDRADPVELRELAVRLALLVWDGYGRPDVALPLLEGTAGRAAAALEPIEHPVATALRLHAAIDSAQQNEALLALAKRLRGHLDLEDEGQRAEFLARRAEIGELLLFRGAYAAAAELLADGGPALERLRALALTLLGRGQEAAAFLSQNPQAELSDLLWAAHLYEQAGEGETSEKKHTRTRQLQHVLERACGELKPLTGQPLSQLPSQLGEGPSSAVPSRLLALLLGVEHLHGLRLRVSRRETLLPLLFAKLELLGGLSALTESQAELVVSNPRALRRIELLTTALQLAGLLGEQGTPEADLEAATLYDAVAGFAARHKEAAAPLGRCLALAECARLCERRGERVAAAERFEALGLLLIDLSGLGGASALSGAMAQTADMALRLDLTAHAAALAYLLRAAELLTPLSEQADAGTTTHAAMLYSRLFELGATDEVLALRRLGLLLPRGREGHTEVVATLSALAETSPPTQSLRFAALSARAAEVLRVPGADVQSAHALQIHDGAPIEWQVLDIESLARRARRRGDHPQLLQLYSLLGSLASTRNKLSAARPAAVFEGTAAAAAAYLSVAVALQAGLTEETDDGGDLAALQESAERQASRPGGVLVDATRVLLQQRLEKDRAADLGTALTTLLGRVRSRETQIQFFRQLGHHAAEQATDLKLAESSFRQVLLRRPDDVMTLHALARLMQQRGETASAVTLLKQAVEAALRIPADGGAEGARGEAVETMRTGFPAVDALLSRDKTRRQAVREVGAQAAALLCCELGALYEQLANMAGDPTAAMEQAVSCYREALRRDARCRPAARALVVLYRAMRRPVEMLAAMEGLLPLLRDDSQRLSLLLELGETALRLAQPEVALRAYGEALSLQPDNLAAIEQMTLLCRRTQRYALLAESLQKAPRTMQVLSALREAFEKLGKLHELTEVYEDQLKLYGEKPSSLEARSAAVSCARALALLYQQLGEANDEARIWERLYDLAPEELWNEVPVLLVLERRYGQGGRHAEQAALLSRALEHLQGEQARRPGDAELRERRKALLLRLGDVQRDSLGAPAQATATFEQVQSEWPQDPAALRALAGLYGSQDRAADQLRVLNTLLEVTVEPGERSRLLFQLAELDEKRGSLDEAYARYGQAFYLDPSNRGAFTAYERMCYRREQWQEAIRIYDTGLKLIETQKTRSYRPADLHVRRGQVLLQYLQKTDEALQNYLRAMESDAENDATQTTIERIYAGRNQWRELLSAYERRAQLVREDIKRVEILRRAARVATAKLRDVAEAVRFYEKLHAVDPTDSEALDALEHHYDRSHDYEKLYGLLSTRVALSVDEQQIIALNMRIGLLSEEGLRDHDRAISAYRHVVEQQPTHREALDAMARLFEANERWAELIDVTRRQIRLVTDRAQKALLYFKCGSVTEAKFGKEDDAIRYYEAAVRTSAACLPALHSLRDIYIRREDWARVTQTLELESKLWTEDKERAGILAHIGQIYLERLGADVRAIEFFEQALSVDKDCLPANRSLFQIYFQRGEWERALGASQVLLQKASREGEPSERSEFHRKRALVALHLGHLRMACESVNTALDIYPESLPVLELLGTLCRRHNISTGFDFAPLCRELEKQFRRRELPRCLARVLCAQAALAEPGADVEATEALLKEAVRLAPDDYLPTEALAMQYEQLRRFQDARAFMESFIAHVGTLAVTGSLLEMRARMQLRLAEMYSTGLLDAEQAIAVLRPLAAAQGETAAGTAIVPAPLRREARFRLAQELYVLGRYAEARGELESLIEAATAQPAAPDEELARYHDYLGRILEAQGEDPASQRAYRRAVDLDPSFSQPVLALARRAVRGGDRAQAELLMRDALDQLARRNRPSLLTTSTTAERSADRLDEELRLRRGIARLLATFDPPQAAEAYQRIIEMATQHLPPDTLRAPSWLDDTSEPLAAWETLDDRVALADLLLHRLGNVNSARKELKRVLVRDLRHAPAYPLLIELYSKNNQADRAERVRSLLSLLGYGAGLPGSPGAGDRRGGARVFAYRHQMSDELRLRYLFSQALGRAPYLELLRVTLPGLLRLFPPPWPLPVETQPASRVWDAAFKVALSDAQRLFGLEVELLFAPQVPGYVLALEALHTGGRPIVVMEQSVLERSDAERRFLLGRALESLRAGYALLLRLSSAEAAKWLRLCKGLLNLDKPADADADPAAQRDGATQEFIDGLLGPAQQAVARLSTAGTELSPEDFLSSLPLLADRAGLLFCDDIAAAARVMARSQGEELAVVEGHGGGILLGQVSGGAELARYYLSDSYHELVTALRDTSRL